MSFDSIARSYRLLETLTFGRSLQRARVCWVNNIPRPKRALILGEGNGRFLCHLLRVHPTTDIDCVDVSARMLGLARRRVSESCPESLKRIRFIHEDILTWQVRRPYDLVVAHFFLDCFRRDELKAIIDKLVAGAAPNATWLIADFVIPARGKITRTHAKLWLSAMYWFFRATAGIAADELVDTTPYLKAKGFELASRKISHARMVKSELWQRGLTACQSNPLPAAV